MAGDDQIAKDRHFKRRDKAAKDGVHLPSEDDMLRGMSFFNGSFSDDITEWSKRLLISISKKKSPRFARLADALGAVAVEVSEENLANVFDAVTEPELSKWPIAEQATFRLVIYLAIYGDEDAICHLISVLAEREYKLVRFGCATEWTPHILSWAVQLNEEKRSRSWSAANMETVPTLSVADAFEDALAKFAAKDDAGQDEDRGDKRSERAAPELNRARVKADDTASASNGIVILRDIGNEETSEGAKVKRQFRELIEKPLPLRIVPDLQAVRRKLVAEFPYAIPIIDAFLNELVGRDHLGWRPTLLVGEPGCGKTRFARRLAEELGASSELVSCGGYADSAIGGTSRRWSSGEPSLPLNVIQRQKIANPVIILDEVEKVSTDRRNGAVHDVLIGMFEKETSTAWHDPYIEAACDISHVCWIMTANEIASISPILRDRCRILKFPDPMQEHLPVLAAAILQRQFEDAGHDSRWAMPLDRIEIDALQRSWQGGSLRKLDRFVAGIVKARAQSAVSH